MVEIMRLAKDQSQLFLTIQIMHQRESKYYNQHNESKCIGITVTTFFIMDKLVFFVKAHKFLIYIVV